MNERLDVLILDCLGSPLGGRVKAELSLDPKVRVIYAKGERLSEAMGKADVPGDLDIAVCLADSGELGKGLGSFSSYDARQQKELVRDCDGKKGLFDVLNSSCSITGRTVLVGYRDAAGTKGASLPLMLKGSNPCGICSMLILGNGSSFALYADNGERLWIGSSAIGLCSVMMERAVAELSLRAAHYSLT